MKRRWPGLPPQPPRDADAETRERLTREVAAAHERATHARTNASRYPRTEPVVDRLLADAEKHEAGAAQLQWNLDNVGVPLAEWSPAPVRDPHDGWAR